MTREQQPAAKLDLAQLESRIIELEARIMEAMRDIETKLLTAFHGYASAQVAELRRLDFSDRTILDRLAALESRVLNLETHPPRP